jgi:tetratricopeptide (TPR) repeat protein
MKRFTFAGAWFFMAIALLGQDQDRSALQGSVRDSQGKPVSGATVKLSTAGQTFDTLSDSQGHYRFGALGAGSYTLQARENGSGEASFGPFQLGQQEDKKVDVTLGSPAKAQFFDEPRFIVAGVTDSSQRGGHGADPVLRSADSLAKATAALATGGAPADTIESLRKAVARDPNRADLHHSLAAAEENSGNSLEAVREYQRAAELENSEANFFDWGTELLTHRAVDQAIDVFTKGNRLFPRSTRTLLGLAVAWYSRGSYDRAAERFFEATDLNPSDPEPYLLLGKVTSGAITESDGFSQRLERFVRLQPENAWANYYYAADLWKHRKGPSDTATAAKVQSTLEKAVRLDSHLGVAFLQLGVVFAAEANFPSAISAFQSAIVASPPMEEAHYRLAQAYRRTGELAKAKKETKLYQQLSKESARKLEQERAEILQFVFALRDESPQNPQ